MVTRKRGLREKRSDGDGKDGREKEKEKGKRKEPSTFNFNLPKGDLSYETATDLRGLGDETTTPRDGQDGEASKGDIKLKKTQCVGYWTSKNYKLDVYHQTNG
ncbi:hypothetical protein ACH5RR_029709 [Cinchona calisaya]|uniref:Uncharacterized protein n=1 Tax=Cinchona calisaya TaxID=153742 RepID=A0ABD2YTN8_9GENT